MSPVLMEIFRLQALAALLESERRPTAAGGVVAGFLSSLH
jgi:hypothetical protein